MSSANYPKEARLHSPSEFAKVFSNKRAIRGVLFTLHFCPNQQGYARLGLVIAKRNARRAVTRATIKRVIREYFRHIRMQLPHQDIIFRLHKNIPFCSLTELKKMVRQDIDILVTKLGGK
ncbi:ribonuclease P [Pelistega indica]|uniref:Ribonuclease P protein component n=1 Tax=Pelistega indica TaxID=1414851 RepID=V8G2Y0_9BURK|nr:MULTISPECIES: ribonuclease P protein component [Pelistega]ETD70007.1 ribonuclease P [Pelistega indica]